MKLTHKFASALTLLSLLVVPVTAQKPVVARSAAVNESVDLDNLVAKDSYIFYAEVRMVGRQAQSQHISEIFEAFKMLESLPKAFSTVHDFLVEHGQELDATRAIIAFSPARAGVPQSLVALEMESPEAAAKLEPAVAKMLSSLSSGAPVKSEVTAKPRSAQKLSIPEIERQLEARGIFLKSKGSLLCIGDSKVDFGALRPANSKPMTDDVLFQTGRSRFPSETLFVYYNQKVGAQVEQRERKESAERVEKLRAEAEAARKKVDVIEMKMPNEAKVVSEVSATRGNDESDPEVAAVVGKTVQGVRLSGDNETPAMGIGAPPPPPASSPSQGSAEQAASTRAFTSMFDSVFRLASKWPDAIAAALSFDGDDLVAHTVLLNKDGEQPVPVPFLPFLITGPPISTRATSHVPGDTDIFVSASLDLPRMFDAILNPPARPSMHPGIQPGSQGANTQPATDTDEPEQPSTAKQIANLEMLLGFRIKEDLIGAFGSEVALAVRTHPKVAKESDKVPNNPSRPNFALLISVQNKDAVQRMLPKLLELMGMKAAGQGATERVDDVEITNYTSFALAFIDDFMVIAENNEAVKEVIESTGGLSLAASNNYRNATAWQPQPRTAQIYTSQALVDSAFTQGTTVFDYAGDEGRAFVTRFKAEPRPISSSLSNDGQTQQHELHVPLASILNWIGEVTIATKYAEVIGNEQTAQFAVLAIANAENTYKQGQGTGQYGTLDDLIKSKVLSAYFQDLKAYRFELSTSGDNFEATATPVEYGQKGKHSFFADQTGILRGGDLGGRRAGPSDPVIQMGRRGGLF